MLRCLVFYHKRYSNKLDVFLTTTKVTHMFIIAFNNVWNPPPPSFNLIELLTKYRNFQWKCLKSLFFVWTPNFHIFYMRSPHDLQTVGKEIVFFTSFPGNFHCYLPLYSRPVSIFISLSALHQHIRHTYTKLLVKLEYMEYSFKCEFQNMQSNIQEPAVERKISSEWASHLLNEI